MPEEEVDALLGRFIRECGGRLTYIIPDPNGDIWYDGKKYIETDKETPLRAIIIEDIPNNVRVLMSTIGSVKIVIVKK